LVFSIQGFSQGAKYGVRGGYNISNLDYDGISASNNKHRNSVYIGFLADFSFSKNFSVQPEIQFSAEGAKEEPVQLDYLQAPVLLKMRLSDKVYLGAGPQVGIKIPKVDDGIKSFAYSGVGTLEYKINYALFVDARYTYGFSNVFDDSLDITAKNTNIQIGIGYKF
jgi:opacity protein-like surface antigen